MKKELKNGLSLLQRPLLFLAALGFLVGIASGVVEAAGAGGQVQSRSIKMSDNGASGTSITSGVGSGTDVTYQVTFEAASSYSIKGLVVDFCSGTAGTPFIGDATCDAPTDFTVGSSPTIDATDGDGAALPLDDGSAGDWTAGQLNSGQTFYASSATGNTLASGTSYTFAITGVTNPSDVGTFYARLLTYTSDTAPASYLHDTPGSYQDYGGFALSTAYVVQVTAKVQESLTFCVSGNSAAAGAPTPPDPNSTAPTDCDDTTTPAITLGHGANDTLDTSAVDTNTVWTIASTNALHGLVIRMHNSNTCGGLSTDGGTTCAIPAVNGGAGADITPGTSGITAGTAAFGMHCYDGVVLTGGTGSIDCKAGYTSTNVSPLDYGMDTTTAGDNVTTTFGDQIATSAAPMNSVENQYDFAATASNTTPAGIYTANLAMIATGTF